MLQPAEKLHLFSADVQYIIYLLQVFDIARCQKAEHKVQLLEAELNVIRNERDVKFEESEVCNHGRR